MLIRGTETLCIIQESSELLKSFIKEVLYLEKGDL